MRDADKSFMLQRLADFNHFCSTMDLSATTAFIRQSGPEDGNLKAVYALAILRAVQNGDFGNDSNANQVAISALWERGHRSGFNVASFNTVFEEFFSCW
jgi:hypothetical protein